MRHRRHRHEVFPSTQKRFGVERQRRMRKGCNGWDAAPTMSSSFESRCFPRALGYGDRVHAHAITPERGRRITDAMARTKIAIEGLSFLGLAGGWSCELRAARPQWNTAYCVILGAGRPAQVPRQAKYFPVHKQAPGGLGTPATGVDLGPWARGPQAQKAWRSIIWGQWIRKYPFSGNSTAAIPW